VPTAPMQGWIPGGADAMLQGGALTLADGVSPLGICAGCACLLSRDAAAAVERNATGLREPPPPGSPGVAPASAVASIAAIT